MTRPGNETGWSPHPIGGTSVQSAVADMASGSERLRQMICASVGQR
jgi:hypothetical protein